jgi:hypothetical protein
MPELSCSSQPATGIIVREFLELNKFWYRLERTTAGCNDFCDHFNAEAAMDDKVQISFDDEFRLRVLDADKYKQTESLDTECTAFVNKIQEFNTTVRPIGCIWSWHINSYRYFCRSTHSLKCLTSNRRKLRQRSWRYLHTQSCKRHWLFNWFSGNWSEKSSRWWVWSSRTHTECNTKPSKRKIDRTREIEQAIRFLKQGGAGPKSTYRKTKQQRVINVTATPVSITCVPEHGINTCTGVTC